MNNNSNGFGFCIHTGPIDKADRDELTRMRDELTRMREALRRMREALQFIADYALPDESERVTAIIDDMRFIKKRARVALADPIEARK